MSASKVDEALQLFASLRGALEMEACQDGVSKTSRARNVRPSPPASPQQSGGVTKAAVSLSQSSRRKSLSSPSALRRESISAGALRQKLDVADGIMRRLHKKNQQLLQQIAALQQQKQQQGAGNVAEIKVMREKLEAREEEVRRLKEYVRRGGPLGKSVGVSAEVIQRLSMRVKEMEGQYNKLLETRVEAVLNGGSKEAICADVRGLFTAMKEKIITDTRRHEVEVLRLNERLFEAERRLATVFEGGVHAMPDL